jgi:CRP/FNR family transcriptional regulator
MDVFKQFLLQYPCQTFKKGETILLKGDRPKNLFIIESGLVKTYTITSSGDERLVSIDSKGEDFPIGYAFELIETSQYFYEAFTRCTVRLIPREKYLEHLHANIESMYKRQVRMTILLLSTLSRVHALEQSSASDKIALTLMYMADRLGVMLRPYTTRLKISVTQQEIADSLGLTRETANIELKKLEMLKLISHSRKSYVLYMERLQKYIEDK